MDNSARVAVLSLLPPQVLQMFVEQVVKPGLRNAQGIMPSLPKKQELMVYLKQVMQEGRLHIPYEPELINEMSVERYELTKTGQMQFSHRNGTMMIGFGHLPWRCMLQDPRSHSTIRLQ